MNLRLHHSLTAALRLLVAAVCCLAIWCSWNLARADYLFRQNTAASIRAAISLVPDDWMYYAHLAQFPGENVQGLLTKALRLNRYDADADINLGLQYEAEGDYAKAEHRLLRAFAVDDTYLPRWSLANFYLRRGNMQAFWTWARHAAQMPSDNTEALFDLCWHISPDPNEISRRILNNNPKLLRQYLAFLLSKDQLPAAAGIATRLLQFGDPHKDTAQMFSVIDRLIAAGDGEAAKGLWSTMIEKRWVVADTVFPNNPNFVREPLPVSFDWKIPSSPGCYSVPGPYGLETAFSGLEPSHCTIAKQAVVLNPGHYVLEYTYRTNGIAPETGLQWQIFAPGSKTALAESPDLSSATRVRTKVAFSIPPGVSVAQLHLIYQRALGTTPIAGSLDVSSVRIEPSGRRHR